MAERPVRPQGDIETTSLQKITTPFKNEYGLGVYIGTINGRRAATHGGGAPPFANLTYFFDAVSRWSCSGI
jgi:hypothetical protein